MLTYQELYEIVRKEKYTELLQKLPDNFLKELGEYLQDRKEQNMQDDGLFSDSSSKNKKQLENSLSLFKELILKRKKKLLNLVFVAAETGIMKRDYENMLFFEKEMFEKFIGSLEEGDRNLAEFMKGRKAEEEKYKLVIFNQEIEQFVDMSGNTLGPFKTGELVNLDKEVSQILVSSGKAAYVDDK